MSYLVSPSYVVSILVPVQGWAGWPRRTRTKRRERIWSKLKLYKSIWNVLLAWEGRGAELAVHCNLRWLFFLPEQESLSGSKQYLSVIELNHDLLINLCVLTAIQISLYQPPTLALWKLPKIVPNLLSLLGISSRNTSLKASIAEWRHISHTYLF